MTSALPPGLARTTFMKREDRASEPVERIHFLDSEFQH